MAEEMNASLHIQQLIDSRLPKILIVSHALGGGVERHVSELVQALWRRCHFIRLVPRNRMFDVLLPGLTQCEDVLRLSFEWPRDRELCWRFLSQLGIERAHVHHVIGFEKDFWADFLSYNLPFDITLHDHCVFNQVIPGSLDVAGRQDWLSRVQRCFSSDYRKSGRHLLLLMHSAQRIFVPSQLLQQYIEACFGGAFSDRLMCCPHAEIEQGPSYKSPWLRPLGSTGSLRVLCLGMLSAEKGALVLARVAREAERQGLQLEFHLLGSCHAQLPQSIQRHGAYRDEDLPGLLDTLAPNVLWLPAQCPETWSYTLSAGLKAGLPVIATNIGVFPERLALRPLSWLYDADCSVSQWIAAFTAIHEKHLTDVGQVHTWRYAKVPDFYTARQGYLLKDAAVWKTNCNLLTRQEISQALALGLPEPESWRRHLLHWLVRLKHASALAPLARLIPYTWQRKIKRLVSRGPLHEPPR